MNLSRTQIAAFASFGFVLAACSAAPPDETRETTGTGQAAVTHEFCPVETAPVCSGGTCRCVPVPPPPPPPPPPVCTMLPAATPGRWVVGWAAQTRNGECPPIAAPDGSGSWQQIEPPTAQQSEDPTFNGDPNEVDLPAPDCSTVFPEPCCTYVWWPATYTGNVDDPREPNGAEQEPGVLCTSNTITLEPLTAGGYCSNDNCHDSGSCSTCSLAN